MNPKIFERKISSLSFEKQSRLTELRLILNKRFGGKINFQFVGMTNGFIDKYLNRAGRYLFFSWAYGREIHSSHELTIDEMFALVMWSKPEKGAREGDEWKFSERAIDDLHILVEVFAEGVGQMPLFKEDERSVDDINHELGF